MVVYRKLNNAHSSFTAGAASRVWVFRITQPSLRDQGLLRQCRIYLTTWGKMIFANRLPDLVRRALN